MQGGGNEMAARWNLINIGDQNKLKKVQNNKTIPITHHKQHLTNPPERQADHYITLTLYKYDTAAFILPLFESF